jgi:hypothetical protein
MNLQHRIILSGKFWLFVTLYTIASSAAFFLTTGGYSIIYLLAYIGPFYLAVWIAVTLLCITSKRLRYSPVLIYAILLIQFIAILFNISDGGYYANPCATKNFVQNFFDGSACGGLWVSHEIYTRILILYVFLAILFILDVLRLRFLHPEQR